MCICILCKTQLNTGGVGGWGGWLAVCYSRLDTYIFPDFFIRLHHACTFHCHVHHTLHASSSKLEKKMEDCQYQLQKQQLCIWPIYTQPNYEQLMNHQPNSKQKDFPADSLILLLQWWITVLQIYSWNH